MPRSPHHVTLGLLIGLLVAASGCTGREPDDVTDADRGEALGSAYTGDYPIRIVATTGQVADLVARIGGDEARVTCLMGPGVDPHLYKATPSDVRSLSEADVIFYNGLHLEGRLGELLNRMARRRPTFAVTDVLHEGGDPRLRESPEFEGLHDPHVWHDASLWSDCARHVADCLVEFDPLHARPYRDRAHSLVAELSALHEGSVERLAAIEKQRRVLITAHDAFGYFGRAYDIEVHGLQGISTVDEPGVAAMQALVDLLVARRVKAVFVESSVPPRGVEALIEACAARGHAVSIGGELFSDAMGPAGTPEGTYVGMFRHNVRTIADALQ